MKKKLLYIDLSFHQKTKSSQFLAAYLSSFYDIDFFYVDSVYEPGVDYSLEIAKKAYDTVLFFQVIPDEANLKKITHPNVIFVPMYDTVAGWPDENWLYLKQLKIISFSKTISEKLARLGFQQVFYLQYFPKPGIFQPGKADEIFFWQRLTAIHFNIIKQFVLPAYKIHLHFALDPGQTGTMPEPDDIQKYHITFSTWFENKEEMEALLKDKAIYIAPRFLEGIGMSFLDAMATGKAVMAFDQPTMNEYIQDHQTGYLFSTQFKTLDFSDLREVQARSYESILDGYEIYLKRLPMIVDFMQ